MDLKKIKNKNTEVAKILKSLAHPKRLLILCFLSDKEMTVGELENLCTTTQSQMSQFLKRLEYENILASRRDGKNTYYYINDPKITKLIKELHKIFC